MDARQIEILKEFHDEFYPKLGETNRWAGFWYIAQQLISLGRPIHIGETGCARIDDNWGGDGQSTRVWDWLIEKLGGTGWSCDITPESCAVAAKYCKNFEIYETDSILFMRQNIERLNDLDLLYLDSFDWGPPYWPSEFHHMAEAAAAFIYIPTNCMIAIDDCHEKYQGKQAVVRRCFDALSLPPSFESYITVWKKPV